jgi:large subunit ribosomal protein L20
MTRVKRGSQSRKRRKKIIKFTRGFTGSHSVLFRTANQQAMKALRYAYVDRRKCKRDFRKLWIQRINGAARLYSFSYSRTISIFKGLNVKLNRKILADLVILDPQTSKKLFSFLEREVKID